MWQQVYSKARDRTLLGMVGAIVVATVGEIVGVAEGCATGRVGATYK